MGVYATENDRLAPYITRAQYELDCLEGTKNLVIKVYGTKTLDSEVSGDFPVYYNTTQSGNDTLLYEWEGTGGFDQMVADWRSANLSVTSGDMYNVWQNVTTTDFAEKKQNKNDVEQYLTYLTRKKAHYQAIVDNGEDPNGVSVEDMNDIIALAP